jgi:Ankyrin repeats (3 copies)
MSDRPSHKRSKSALALSLLRGERPPKGDSGSESGSPLTHTTSNNLLAPTASTGSNNSVSPVDDGSLGPAPHPTDSNVSLKTAEKVAPSGIPDHKMSIEDSVRTFRIFEVLRSGDKAAISKSLKEASSSKIPGTTMLHLAIQCAEPQVVEYVLSNSNTKDVNSRDKEGNTPLHLAAQLGRTPIVKRLLQHPDINESVPNCQGRTPIDVARTPEIFQELQLARSLFIDSVVRQVRGFVAHSDHRRLEDLLVDPRVESILDVNALELVTDRETMAAGGTLLHEGSRKKDTALIQILLMHGADPFRRDRRGKLPQDVTRDDRTRAILKKSPAAVVAQRGIQEKAILGGIPGQKVPAGASTDVGKEGREMKGYLKKWTNYTSGYKLRWFVLEDGVLSYYKHQGILPALLLKADRLFSDLSIR